MKISAFSSPAYSKEHKTKSIKQIISRFQKLKNKNGNLRSGAKKKEKLFCEDCLLPQTTNVSLYFLHLKYGGLVFTPNKKKLPPAFFCPRVACGRSF
jgi:hypothetical protein